MTENIKIIKLGCQSGNSCPSTTSDAVGQQNNSEQLVIVPEIARLFECYLTGYQPPKWVGLQEFQPAIWKYSSQSIVYYPSGANLVEVKKLATQREPTNLGGNKLYNRDGLLAEYGYTESPYQIGSPNIAIFCRTPVITGRTISPTKVKYANILSAIAPALDTQDQPDYRYLASDPRQPKRNCVYDGGCFPAYPYLLPRRWLPKANNDGSRYG